MEEAEDLGDDFYEEYESRLDDDEISAWEEAFIKGFTDDERGDE